MVKESPEVYEWIRRYQQTGDKEAQLKLVTYYEAFVRSLSRKYSLSNKHEEDMFQVGMIGLLGAISRYDESRGYEFRVFLIPTIIGELKRYIRDKTWSVSVPRRVKELRPKINQAIDYLLIEKERFPYVTEIAQFLNVTEKDVTLTLEMGKNYHPLSVDRPIDEDAETMTLLEVIGDEERGYVHIDRKLLLEDAFRVLTRREQQIVYYTYFHNLSQKETGEKLGISQMHVSRLLRRSLHKLRATIQLEVEEVFG